MEIVLFLSKAESLINKFSHLVELKTLVIVLNFSTYSSNEYIRGDITFHVHCSLLVFNPLVLDTFNNHVYYYNLIFDI